MGEFIAVILSKSSTDTIFLVLFLSVLWLLRQDSKEHKKEYKETVRQMFDVVNQNTASNEKLRGSIDHLREKINDSKS